MTSPTAEDKHYKTWAEIKESYNKHVSATGGGPTEPPTIVFEEDEGNVSTIAPPDVLAGLEKESGELERAASTFTDIADSLECPVKGIELSYLDLDEVLGIYTISGHKGRLPDRMRWLHPDAAESFEDDLAPFVVCSDMLRSPEASLRAIKNKKGALPPGWSGHGYGWCIDIDKKATMKNIGLKTKAELDAWMAERGWYCHRRDSKSGFEDWHYNYFGADFAKWVKPTDKRTSTGLERMLKAQYGFLWKMDLRGVQAALKQLSLYGGLVDGKKGPLTKEAIEAFQRTWNLTVDGKAGAKTKRTLGFITAQRILV